MGIGGSIESALDRYEQRLRISSDMQERSIKDNVRRLSTYIDPLAPLDSLRASAIRKILDKRLTTTRKITIKKELVSLKAFARFVAKHFPEYLSRSQLDQILELGQEIKLGPGESRRKPQLTFDESLQFVETALSVGGARGCAALCALLLGLRGGEILALKSKHIDHGGRVVRVPGTKSANAARVITVDDPRLQGLLLSLKREPGDYLIRSLYSASGRRSQQWLRRTIFKLCDLAGVSRVPPHGLRGSLATRAIGLGIDPSTVAAYLGHSSSGVTLEHYAKPGSEAVGTAHRAQLRVINGG